MSSPSVIDIGLLCNCSLDRDPGEELSASLVNRAFLIDRLLRPSGMRLFLFSPRDVVTLAKVPGYTIDGDKLVRADRPMPGVNANWTYGTRRLINEGMGYSRFKRMMAENRIGIFVPYGFAELVSNKRKAYEAVRRFDAALHPHTEDYSGSLVQLESFLGRASSVFIKPRSGNRGNRIFVARRAAEGYLLRYYDQRRQQLFGPLTLEAAVSVIQGAASGRSYVIQDGIQAARAGGSVFDVRVVMVNDGSRWHAILESRLAPPGSDLSNIFQGGSIQVTESLLAQCLGDGAAQELLERIVGVSHELAGHFEASYPGELMEMGFDFILDQQRRVHLVEVNSKPGVAGFGSERKLFEWTAEDDLHYRRWVQPHVSCLAAFLKTQVERPRISGT